MPGFDRISELPEHLITRILLHLPTKDSVKTSVLSTRWKNLWLNVPGLDLNCRDFPFENGNEDLLRGVIDRFLEFNTESPLEIFKVDYSRAQVLGSKDRIATAVNRGIKVLDLKSNTYYRDAHDCFIYPVIDLMPLNLFTSKTLVSLKLFFSGLVEYDGPVLVSMPCLKFMHLHHVKWRSGGTMTLEKLVLGCPVLQELTYVMDPDDDDQSEDVVVVTRVTSRSLKRFSVPFDDVASCYSRVVHAFEIDAPGLEYLSLKEDNLDKIVVKNLTSLFMIDLDITPQMFDPDDLSKRNEIRELLTGISSVRHMIISHQTVKAIELYSKVGPIPKFNNLSRLQAAFPSDLLQFLPAFLESFPNLKHLILKIVYSRKEMEEFNIVNVPCCLVSTLEFVEIKGLLDWEEEEVKIASYFLENSAVLKKLILNFMVCPQYHSESDIYDDLNKLTKRSPRCRMIIAEELDALLGEMRQ